MRQIIELITKLSSFTRYFRCTGVRVRTGVQAMAEISNFQISFVDKSQKSLEDFRRIILNWRVHRAINQRLFLMYADSEKVVYLHIHI